MVNQDDLKRFDELYDNSYRDISKYVVCHCSYIEDVKDILQNIYLDVLKNISQIDNEAYIMAIAKNKVKDYYRFHYKKRIKLLFEKEDKDIIADIPSDIDIERSFSVHYDVEIVWKYLKTKKVIISQIFYLYYYLGLSLQEISNELNISESNVKNHLYRTLKELKAYLESENQ